MHELNIFIINNLKRDWKNLLLGKQRFLLQQQDKLSRRGSIIRINLVKKELMYYTQHILHDECNHYAMHTSINKNKFSKESKGRLQIVIHKCGSYINVVAGTII